MKYITILLLLSGIVLLEACNTNSKKECCSKNNKMNNCDTLQSALSDESVFNLESKWITQTNDSILLSELSGKTTIAAMVFTHCESACPRIVADMQRIEKSFSENELNNIQFLLISMDPERDTPERFSVFAKEHQLNNRWICISSTDAATMEIANVLNVKIKKLSGGGFDHSNTIFLIDRQGNIVYQQNGLEQEPTEIIQKAKSLIRNQ